MGEYWG